MDNFRAELSGPANPNAVITSNLSKLTHESQATAIGCVSLPSRLQAFALRRIHHRPDRCFVIVNHSEYKHKRTLI